jgi:hypothetical protein
MNYKHPEGINITISGKLNSNAKTYQEEDVKRHWGGLKMKEQIDL